MHHDINYRHNEHFYNHDIIYFHNEHFYKCYDHDDHDHHKPVHDDDNKRVLDRVPRRQCNDARRQWIGRTLRTSLVLRVDHLDIHDVYIFYFNNYDQDYFDHNFSDYFDHNFSDDNFSDDNFNNNNDADHFYLVHFVHDFDKHNVVRSQRHGL